MRVDFVRRAIVALVGVSSGFIGFAGTANAAVLPAGNYEITTVTAGAFFFNSNPPYDSASLFVTDTITLAQTGSSRSSTNLVAVNASWSGPNGSGSGCSILANPNDFTFSSDLSSAALHTSFTQGLQACDSFEPLVPDVTVDATWTGPATSGGGHTISRYACGGYQSEALGTGSHTTADARFAFGGAAGPYEDSAANLGLTDQSVHAQGSLPDACITPGGKGFGIGPRPAGRYVLSSTGAAFNSIDGAVNLFVRNSTFTSNPNGPSSDRFAETDLFVNVNGAFGCFVIAPSSTAISSNLSGATLHISLDQNTPQCGFSFFPYLPLSIDMKLTAAGPLATTQTNAPNGCFTLFFFDQATHAGGSATLLFGDGTTITDPAAPTSEIDSSDHTFRMSGSTPCTP